MPANPQALKRLEQVNDNQWITIIKHLVLYAEARLTNVGFTPRSELDSVTGEDFAMDGIMKVLNGDRAWDFEKYPDLLIHLKGVVKSLISNHLKASNRSVVRRPAYTQQEEISDNEAQYSDNSDPTPEALIEEPDPDNPLAIVLQEEQWQQIEAAFGSDQDGYIFFTDWLDDMPPREIAENYGIDIKTVYNTIKKGRRIITKVYAQR